MQPRLSTVAWSGWPPAPRRPLSAPRPFDSPEPAGRLGGAAAERSRRAEPPGQLEQVGRGQRARGGTARQLELQEAAAAFNRGWRVGRGSAGCDPSHWRGDPPASEGRGGARAAPPAPATLGAADAGCGAGIRYRGRLGGHPVRGRTRWRPPAPSLRRAPGGGAGLGWASGRLAPLRRARRLLPSVAPSRSEERPPTMVLRSG